MIVEKQLSPTLVRHYSDKHKMIRQIETGVLYADAVDTIPCRYTYEETDEPIPTEEFSHEIEQRVDDLEDAVVELAEIIGG